MGFLDILRKLGILRYGAKAAVYRDAASRPAEFEMDGVFNVEKDLKSDSAKGQKGDRSKPK